MNASWKRHDVRLVLMVVSVAAALWAFAYWWLGNAVHEAIGLIFCVVVLRHVLNNLFWWKRLRHGPWTLSRIIQIAVNLALAICVLALAGTSFAISRSVLAYVPLPDVFALRETHWFTAYCFLALMALHLGMNAPRITAALGRATGVSGLQGRWRGAIWAIAIAVSAQGIVSGAILGVWQKLLFRYSLAMWDFNASVLPFFGHLLAMVSLFVVIGRLMVRASDALSPARLRSS